MLGHSAVPKFLRNTVSIESEKDYLQLNKYNFTEWNQNLPWSLNKSIYIKGYVKSMTINCSNVNDSYMVITVNHSGKP